MKFKLRHLLTLLLAGMIMSLFNSCTTKNPSKKQKGSIVTDSIRYLKPVFENVHIEKDIPFAEVLTNKDSLVKLCLDVYVPESDSVTNRPVILWVHGGGFKGGTKTQSYVVTLANAFTRKGYVCISTDYRLREYPREDMEGTIQDAVSDVEQALDWVRNNAEKYGYNKDYIAIGGGSAGGILSTNLCYNSDPGEWDKPELFAFINLWGSPGQERMYAPIDKNGPPAILIHGKNDSIVPFSNCEWLAGELNKAGIHNTVVGIDNAGHTPTDYMDDIVDRTSSFLFSILSEK